MKPTAKQVDVIDSVVTGYLGQFMTEGPTLMENDELGMVVYYTIDAGNVVEEHGVREDGTKFVVR